MPAAALGFVLPGGGGGGTRREDGPFVTPVCPLRNLDIEIIL